MNKGQCPLKLFEEKLKEINVSLLYSEVAFLASQPFPQKNKRAERTIVLPTRLTFYYEVCYLNLELGNSFLSTFNSERRRTSHYTIASFMHSTIYRTSSSVTYGPAGRQKPTLKISSDTPLI